MLEDKDPSRSGSFPPYHGCSVRRLDPQALGDHLDAMYRAAWAMCGSREDAEDLVQDTFARVLARPRSLRSADDLGYLLQVLRNTFISGRRTAARRPRTTPMPEGFEPADARATTRPDAAIEAQNWQRTVSREVSRKALGELTTKGMVYNEIAPAELAKMRAAVKPVYDKFSAAYDPAIVNLFKSELERVSKL